jgi:hypothetical protein
VGFNIVITEFPLTIATNCCMNLSRTRKREKILFQCIVCITRVLIIFLFASVKCFSILYERCSLRLTLKWHYVHHKSLMN